MNKELWELKWQWFYDNQPTSQEYSVKGDYNSCNVVYQNIHNSFLQLKSSGCTIELAHSMQELAPLK